MDGSIDNPFEQDPADAIRYPVDFGPALARFRKPDTGYAVNVRVRPNRANGYQYNATVAGRTGSEEPRWPTTVGGTVRDGSVTWTCEAVSSASFERTLTGTTWSADAGLTLTSEIDEDEESSAIVSGGTDGQTYMVRVVGALSDGTRNAVFYVRVVRPTRRVTAC